MNSRLKSQSRNIAFFIEMKNKNKAWGQNRRELKTTDTQAWTKIKQTKSFYVFYKQNKTKLFCFVSFKV